MKRQKNVQEQINERRQLILGLAADFKQYPEQSQWLADLLERYKLNPENGVLVELKEVEEQGPIYDYEAIWLTKEKNFIVFSGEADYKTRELLSETFEPKDITDSIEFNKHKGGIGKTFGILAIEVLEQLC